MSHEAFTTELAHSLKTALESCRFSEGGRSYSADQLRKRFYYERDLVDNHVWATISTEETNRMATLLKNGLAVRGIEWEKVHVNPAVIGPGFGTKDVQGLVHSTLRGAAVVGTEKAAEIVCGWLHGERLGYVRNYAINPRLNLDSRITIPCELGYDAFIREYKPHEHSTQIQALIKRNKTTLEGLSSAELHFAQLKCRGRPAISIEQEDDHYDDERLNLVKGEVLLSVLSIETGQFIGGRFNWVHYGDLEPFISRSEKPVMVDTEVGWPSEIPISPARMRRIGRSWQGVYRYVDLKSVRAWYYNVPVPSEIKKSFLSTRRWRRAASFLPGGLLEDNFMELRVVLDLLLLAEGEWSRSSSLEKRAAAWIGTKGVDGRSTSECVKALYDISSHILHTGTFRESDDALNEYSIGLAITRKLLRRGLAKGFEKW